MIILIVLTLLHFHSCFGIKLGLSFSASPLYSNLPQTNTHYATHHFHHPHDSSGLHHCLSPRYQILTNFYGDYFQPGVMCLAGGGGSFPPFIDIRNGGSGQQDGGSMVVSSFDDGAACSDVTKDCQPKLCKEVPQTCQLLQAMTERSRNQEVQSLKSSSLLDTLRNNLSNLYSQLNRRSVTSTSSSPPSSFPLFSLFSTPPFSGGFSDPKPTIYRDFSENQLKDTPIDNGQRFESVRGRPSPNVAPLSVSPPSPPPMFPGHQSQNQDSSLRHRFPLNHPPGAPPPPFGPPWAGQEHSSGLDGLPPGSISGQNNHFSLGQSYSVNPTYPMNPGTFYGGSPCEEIEGVAYPLVGISVLTGEAVVIRQQHPHTTQPVFYRKCGAAMDGVPKPPCIQQFLPMGFIVEASSVRHGRSVQKENDLKSKMPIRRSSRDLINDRVSRAFFKQHGNPHQKYNGYDTSNSQGTDLKLEFVMVESGCKNLLQMPQPYSQRRN